MGKYLATVQPDFDAGAATGSAYSDNDILFTWTPFNIPKSIIFSGLCLITISYKL